MTNNAPHRRRTRISIVSPCYNEQECIGLFCDAIKAVLEPLDVDYELVLVDDGSRDETLAVLNRLAAADPRIRALSLSRNFGHQVALTAGLDAACGDAVIMMDSDLQHPPELIPTLLERWRGGFDVVSAVRQRTEGASLFKRLSSDGFYWVLNLLSETKVKPGAADFCLLSARAHAALRSMPERHRFLRGMVAWIGFPRAYVEYEAARRAAGTSKYSITKMLRLAFDATFSFSITPIKVATRLGVTVAVLGLVYLVYVVAVALFYGQAVQGWASMLSALLILGGIQLMFIGVIGAYIGRVFEEVKGRPVYLLKQGPDDLPAAAAAAAATLKDEDDRNVAAAAGSPRAAAAHQESY